MTAALWLALLATSQTAPPISPPGANPVLVDLLARGITVEGVGGPLPAPKLPDGADAAASRAVVLAVVGDERGVANFTRDSVTAPFVLRTNDTRAGGTTVRAGDLYFVLHADLDALDLKQTLGRADEATTEAGNMRFTTRLLRDADLPGHLDRLPPAPGRDEWFTHATGRLLDRIGVDSTSRAVATRTADSLTVAVRTDPAFGDAGPLGNRWAAITRQGTTETVRAAQVYMGGGSYIKATRLAAVPGALFVEAHFAFAEPDAWFDGNPILRSKLGLICQDQVRQVRRNLPKNPTPK